MRVLDRATRDANTETIANGRAHNIIVDDDL